MGKHPGKQHAPTRHHGVCGDHTTTAFPERAASHHRRSRAPRERSTERLGRPKDVCVFFIFFLFVNLTLVSSDLYRN
jgi:hypothetical protein